MSNHEELTRDIIIRLIEHGYIPKAHGSLSDDVRLSQHLESVKTAYREIYETVTNPTK